MPQRQGFAGPPAGALQEALNASDDLKNIMGLHDASLGSQGNETSGRAIMARQREGDVATFNFIDNQSRAIRHTGRILVDLIPKIYDVPRIIRVIKEDGSNYSVPVNQPVQEAPQQEGQGQPQGQPQYQPVPEHLQDELAGLTKVFDLASGKYDVTCESGPSFTSRREEASQQMMEFIRVFPQAAPFVGDLLAKNLDWPGSDDIAKRLQAMLPPQAQGDKPPQLQQAEQAIQQLHGQLQQQGQQLQEKQSDLQLRQGELQIKQYDAETKRMQLQKDQQPAAGIVPDDRSFEQWSIQFAAEQALELQQMKQDGAERLELLKQAQPEIQAQSVAESKASEALAPDSSEVMGLITQLSKRVSEINAHMSSPRKIVRGPDGKVTGVDVGGMVKPINRSADGRVEGY
jgi:hypothetical protein